MALSNDRSPCTALEEMKLLVPASAQLQSIKALMARSINSGCRLQLLLVIAEQSLRFSPYECADDEVFMLSQHTEYCCPFSIGRFKLAVLV